MPFRGAAKRGLITSVTSRVPSGRTTASTSKLSMTVCDAAGTGAATRTASRGANPSTLRRARRSRIPGLIGLASPALLSGGAEADLGHFTLGGHGHFKELARLEVEHPGEDVRGELRDFGVEVVAALELHINVGPGVIALHLETHQAVVHADGKHQHNRDDNQKNQHRTSLGRLKWLRSFRRSLYALALHPVKRDAARPHGGPGQYPRGTPGRRNPHTKLRLEKWPSVQRRQRRFLSGKARAISLRAG